MWIAREPGVARVFLTLLLLGTGTDTWADDARRLLELSGVADQVELVPVQVKAEMTSQLRVVPGLPETVLQSVEHAIDKSLAPGSIVDGVAERVQGTFDPAQTSMLLDWYRSDLGKRVVAAEVLASTQPATERIMATMNELLADTERAEAARTINELYGGTDNALHVLEVSQVAMASALMEAGAAAGAPRADYDRASLVETVRSALESARPDIERYLIASYVFAYRDLSDAELKQLIEFLSRPETRLFNERVTEGLTLEWERAFGSMADAVIGAITAAQARLDTA